MLMAHKRAAFSMIAAALLFTPQSGFSHPSNSTNRLCAIDYSYAGLVLSRRVYGVRADIKMLAEPVLKAGHVAAWVGVGANGYAADPLNQWLQVGIFAYPDGITHLYYEVAQPGYASKAIVLRSNINFDETFHVAVLAVKSHPGAWRVWVNGQAVSPMYYLRGSRNGRSPEITAESWNAERNTCSVFSYRFTKIAVAESPGGSWVAFRGGEEWQDPGYEMIRNAVDGFTARSRP
jgi:hypothetical protein